MSQIECRYCDNGKMVEQTYSERVKSGRSMLLVKGLLKWHCKACESEMIDARQFEKNAERIEEEEKQSPSFVSIAMLLELRERYALSQIEASKLVGAGEGAFGKYESGGKLSGPTAKLVRAALAIPAVVEMLAAEEGIKLAASPKARPIEGFNSSIQEALRVASPWRSDAITMPGQLAAMFAKGSCTNDNQHTATTQWSNARSMEFMRAAA